MAIIIHLLLSKTAFILQCQSWVILTETVWLAKCKILFGPCRKWLLILANKYLHAVDRIPFKRNNVTWRYCKKINISPYVSLDVTRQYFYQCRIKYKIVKTVIQHAVESGCKGNYKHQGWLLWNLEKMTAGK